MLLLQFGVAPINEGIVQRSVGFAAAAHEHPHTIAQYSKLLDVLLMLCQGRTVDWQACPPLFEEAHILLTQRLHRNPGLL